LPPILIAAISNFRLTCRYKSVEKYLCVDRYCSLELCR